MSDISKNAFNPKTFNSKCEELWPEIYKYVYYNVQNVQEAEELTQEVFRKVIAQLKKSIVAEDKIKNYLFTTARNTIYDSWRKKRIEPVTVPLYDSKSENMEVEGTCQVIEHNMVVKEALNKLSENEKEIIVLRIIEGLSVNEVFFKTGKSPGTIKSLQYRALQKLRRYIDEGGYFK